MVLFTNVNCAEISDTLGFLIVEDTLAAIQASLNQLNGSNVSSILFVGSLELDASGVNANANVISKMPSNSVSLIDTANNLTSYLPLLNQLNVKITTNVSGTVNVSESTYFQCINICRKLNIFVSNAACARIQTIMSQTTATASIVDNNDNIQAANLSQYGARITLVTNTTYQTCANFLISPSAGISDSSNNLQTYFTQLQPYAGNITKIFVSPLVVLTLPYTTWVQSISVAAKLVAPFVISSVTCDNIKNVSGDCSLVVSDTASKIYNNLSTLLSYLTIVNSIVVQDNAAVTVTYLDYITYVNVLKKLVYTNGFKYRVSGVLSSDVAGVVGNGGAVLVNDTQANVTSTLLVANYSSTNAANIIEIFVNDVEFIAIDYPTQWYFAARSFIKNYTAVNVPATGVSFTNLQSLQIKFSIKDTATNIKNNLVYILPCVAAVNLIEPTPFVVTDYDMPTISTYASVISKMTPLSIRAFDTGAKITDYYSSLLSIVSQLTAITNTVFTNAAQITITFSQFDISGCTSLIQDPFNVTDVDCANVQRVLANIKVSKVGLVDTADKFGAALGSLIATKISTAQVTDGNLISVSASQFYDSAAVIALFSGTKLFHVIDTSARFNNATRLQSMGTNNTKIKNITSTDTLSLTYSQYSTYSTKLVPLITKPFNLTSVPCNQVATLDSNPFVLSMTVYDNNTEIGNFYSQLLSAKDRVTQVTSAGGSFEVSYTLYMANEITLRKFTNSIIVLEVPCSAVQYVLSNTKVVSVAIADTTLDITVVATYLAKITTVRVTPDPPVTYQQWQSYTSATEKLVQFTGVGFPVSKISTRPSNCYSFTIADTNTNLTAELSKNGLYDYYPDTYPFLRNAVKTGKVTSVVCTDGTLTIQGSLIPFNQHPSVTILGDYLTVLNKIAGTFVLADCSKSFYYNNYSYIPSNGSIRVLDRAANITSLLMSTIPYVSVLSDTQITLQYYAGSNFMTNAQNFKNAGVQITYEQLACANIGNVLDTAYRMKISDTAANISLYAPLLLQNASIITEVYVNGTLNLTYTQYQSLPYISGPFNISQVPIVQASTILTKLLGRGTIQIETTGTDLSKSQNIALLRSSYVTSVTLTDTSLITMHIENDFIPSRDSLTKLSATTCIAVTSVTKNNSSLLFTSISSATANYISYIQVSTTDATTSSIPYSTWVLFPSYVTTLIANSSFTVTDCACQSIPFIVSAGGRQLTINDNSENIEANLGLLSPFASSILKIFPTQDATSIPSSHLGCNIMDRISGSGFYVTGFMSCSQYSILNSTFINGNVNNPTYAFTRGSVEDTAATILGLQYNDFSGLQASRIVAVKATTMITIPFTDTVVRAKTYMNFKGVLDKMTEPFTVTSVPCDSIASIIHNLAIVEVTNFTNDGLSRLRERLALLLVHAAKISTISVTEPITLSAAEVTTYQTIITKMPAKCLNVTGNSDAIVANASALNACISQIKLIG